MRRHSVDAEVLGPWRLTTSRAFWEGFSPAALDHQQPGDGIRTVFRVEADWSRAEVEVTQHGHLATISVAGDGDLEAAADQVRRFLSLDVDARGWPDLAGRDPVIADAQAQLPGLRPCGFHSPYEAAASSVLSQRIRIIQAARLRRDLIDRHGDQGAFPAPRVLRALDLDLPGRKTEYLHAVADAALEGAPRPSRTASRRARRRHPVGPGDQGARAVRGRAGGAARRLRPRRPPPQRGAPGR